MAMATVVWVVTLTGIIAATLATMTVFAIGHTSSNRASVQAVAAAEAGIDYARTRLMDPTICRPDPSGGPATIASPTPGPVFTVRVQYQRPNAPTGEWVNGCPVAEASEVRLRATGDAIQRGVAGQSSGDVETVDSVYTGRKLEFPYVEMTTQSPRAGGHLLEFATGTEGTGLTTRSATAAQFPGLTKDDYRWRRFDVMSVPDMAAGLGAGLSSTCTLTATAGATALRVTVPLRVEARSSSCSALRLSSATGARFTVELGADLVIFADQFELSGTLVVRSTDGLPHTLYVVRPWTGSCASDAADVKIGRGAGGTGIQTLDGARVMLYSAAGMVFGESGAPQQQDFAGQIYACSLWYHDKVRLTYAPATARILGNDAPWPATQLVSKLDIPNP
ncbi:hypothetical protein [Cellulomonas aerilata]|uniref:Uncharacterized protein n=1 Tax=Cellulomonas aerilata TaxID=515326 RepID=A0A512DAA5_9CELL|nr:hypothetical protein [Cellulomonas aerilata]GEO33403.1 hypothetical protein CAE01nite_11280 [Cellulomonas aerilata]